FLQNTLSPDEVGAEPTPADTRAEIVKLVLELSVVVHDLEGPAAVQARRLASAEPSEVIRDPDSPAVVQARRLASVLAPLVHAPPAALNEAEHALVTPLRTTLRQAKRLLSSQRMLLGTLTPMLTRPLIS